ncbi:DUF421 domain-containing protein [Bacillus marinisedimentorum]|uniref:DUF421 domain-containing protein n=1 Tax=Bacillus marinisedimentorum TaxID=1821260 RepID=UPI0007DF1083|nr:DUF421 domain-containing protein [Bacillus marinisedimentorum]
MFTTITLKLVIGLIALILITRLLGKKEMAQVTPFDFVYALILGGIIEEGIYDTKTKIYHVIYAAALWAVLIYTVEKLPQKFEKIRKPLKGKTAIIIENGEIDIKEMKKAKLEMEQVRTMLRMQGVFSVSDVKYAFLEVSGQLSVMKYADQSPVTAKDLGVDTAPQEPSILLIDEGMVHEKSLKVIGKDKSWLDEQLGEHDIRRAEDVFYAEWTRLGGFYIRTYEDERHAT